MEQKLISRAVTDMLGHIIENYIKPDEPVAMGETARNFFQDAEIELTRRANRFGLPVTAQSFAVRIDGDTFNAVVRAVWRHREATVEVQVLEVGPTDDAFSDFLLWLKAACELEDVA